MFAPQMPHFISRNATPQQVKWLAFALKTSVVLAKSLGIPDVEVWQNGWCVQGKQMVCSEQTDDVFGVNGWYVRSKRIMRSDNTNERLQHPAR